MTSIKERTAHISRWKKSGKSKKAYCQTSGINYATFMSWFKKEREEVLSEGSFVEIGHGPMSYIEIVFPNGIRLFSNGELSVTLLKSLSDV